MFEIYCHNDDSTTNNNGNQCQWQCSQNDNYYY